MQTGTFPNGGTFAHKVPTGRKYPASVWLDPSGRLIAAEYSALSGWAQHGRAIRPGSPAWRYLESIAPAIHQRALSSA